MDIGWEDPKPQVMRDKWIAILELFLRMEDIIINRAVRPIGVEGSPELVGFSDGSLLAYTAAIYIRRKKIKAVDSDQDEYFLK